MNEVREKLKHILSLMQDRIETTGGFLSMITKSKKTEFRKVRDLIIQETSYLLSDCSFSERLYNIKNDLYSISKCKHCQIGNVKFQSYLKGYQQFCCSKCVNSSLQTQEKKKQTTLKNYSVENPSQSEKVKEKVKHTNLKNYGVEYVLQSEDVMNKYKHTVLNNSFQHLLNSDRLKKHYIPMFDVTKYHGVKGQYYPWKCVKCNTVFKATIANGRIPRCPTCYPPHQSQGEQELISFVKQYFTNVELNNRVIISPKELDIFIPELKLAIEYNGLYWHSELNGKNREYHQKKTLDCLKQGITLVHIFEDEWINKQDIAKSILLNKFGKIQNRIYARKCNIWPIQNHYARQFLDDNHLQGSINGDHYGLSYNNQLVSLITVGKSRFSKKYDLEILRFCSKINTNVIGGLSKLIKHVQKIYNKQSIITYADLRFGIGSGYKKCGFEYVDITHPGYFYTKCNSRYSRQQFQKHKLKNILADFDSNLTEYENMQLNGYDRIWDCGNAIYLMENF